MEGYLGRGKEIYIILFCWGGAYPLQRWYALYFWIGVAFIHSSFVVQHPHTIIGLCGSSTIIF